MVCLGCHQFTGGRLCAACRATIRPAKARLLPGGIPVLAAFEHEGAAKTLVHHLKYRGVAGLAELIAEVLEPRVPRLPLVPIPRAWSRRIKYGVDPSQAIAAALARRLKTPVVDGLVPPLHSQRRAGRDHSRPVEPFRARLALRYSAIIVDDVVTTGATAVAAVGAMGAEWVQMVVSASVVSEPSTLGAQYD